MGYVPFRFAPILISDCTDISHSDLHLVHIKSFRKLCLPAYYDLS